MARSLNKVILIGNLTRDPELRYTPNGVAVATFGVATNRQWATESGEKKEDVEFHRVVAWNKLAEICAQLLAKGRKVFIEGRLQTRDWTGDDNVKRSVTEIVATEMILLDSKGMAQADDFEGAAKDSNLNAGPAAKEDGEKPVKKSLKKKEKKVEDEEEEIPF